MKEYKRYSRDLWDYIKDLPYMPSRANREKLFNNERTHERVKLWDYFFRIKPEDVGKPQRKEISSLIKKLRESIDKCKLKEKEIFERINELERFALIKAIKRLILISIVLAVILLYISRISTEIVHDQDKYIYNIIVAIPCSIISLVFISLGYIAGKEKKESRRLYLNLKEYKELHFIEINEVKNRINTLKKEIGRLRRQVPKPLSGEEARQWLNREFQKLWDYTKTEVALVRNIIKIQGEQPDSEIKNPLSILGPGELQEKIPRRFLATVNEDLNKHLTAKQAYQLNPEKYSHLYDVLYGVYFLEYIVVATDMLVTHSFFYDFIDDKVTSEYTTEQYFTDIVALAIVHESRKITIIDNMGKPISVYIEDSPVFTLSLKSGERHEVSFVNQDYFIKVKERLEINLDDIDKIYWINQAKGDADNVIKALRAYLRKHKAL